MSLILTLALDTETFNRLDALRQAHFPAERNFLSAHLTLFHQLGDVYEPAIITLLEHHARRAPVPFQVSGFRSLGRGVAAMIEAPSLKQLRRSLSAALPGERTPQDAQGAALHVTIQNKVTAAAARTLLDRVQAGVPPWQGMATGFLLWRYLGGPWSLVREIDFVADAGVRERRSPQPFVSTG